MLRTKCDGAWHRSCWCNRVRFWSLQDEVKILRRIGEGAFGEVSLATCAIFGSVAVKWLKVRTLQGVTQVTELLWFRAYLQAPYSLVS